MKRVLAAAVVLAMVCVPAASAWAEPAVQTAEVAGQDISELRVSTFSSNDSDTTRPDDAGHIYVGYAITDGGLDADNSNWETDDIGNITLDNVVEGEGFTAVRAWGGDTQVNVTGSLVLEDQSDGTYASDFTGTGAAITAANGAGVYVNDMMYQSDGFLRSFGIVENGTMIISNSDITALGADPLTDAYEGYYNSAQTSMMLSPPWVLGIQGGIRAVNVLGREHPSTFVAMDSIITSGGWADVSTDGCTTPQLYFFHCELNMLPLSEGGMYSGFEILGYDEDLYGSGYGTYYIGDASESFYGTDINGATYGSILRGGYGVYEGLEGGVTYQATDVNGELVAEYEAAEDCPTVVNTVWGIMNHGGGTIDFNEGSVWNNVEGTVLCKEADTIWNFNGAELHPGNCIIFQMMDNDDNTIGGFDPFGTYLTEEAGFPTDAYEDAVAYVFTEDEQVDPSKTYYQADIDAEDEGGYIVVEEPTQEGIIAYYEKSTGGGKAEVSFANGDYAGSVYNGTGYYGQAADALYVDIADDATLIGDIALTSHVHGIFLDDRDVDDVITAIEEANAYHENIGGYYEGLEDIEYVFLDEEGNVTEDKDEAVAIQFTKFSVAEYYLLGHVLNKINYNGLSSLDVTVEGTWTPVRESLVTYLNVEEGAHVYGKLTELGDGTIVIVPSEEELEPGEYGNAFVYVEAPASEGESGEGESTGDEAAEGALPEGAAAEGAAEGNE